MPSPSPPPPQVRRRPGVVGRAERCCSVTMKFFPLALVYGLTTWAIWSQGQICLRWEVSHVISYTTLFLSLFLYAMTNWCYTVAVFTDPGSPLHPVGTAAHFSRHNYSFLPLTQPRDTNVLSLTVKSSGATRYCKKCQCKKPDRAHHCSTCGRCVLKMDHHCPWLATCVGLQNYKPFLLFCIYVTLFCWVCFGASATFVTFGVRSQDMVRYGEYFAVNSVLLAIIGGIFGLVLTGFTGWHISLAVCNQTTIECLEKTRYLRPIRRTMDRATHAFPSQGRGRARGRSEDEGLLQHYGHQLAEMHANAIPGITRAEEGEERIGPGTRGGGNPDRIDLGEVPYSDAEPGSNARQHLLPHPGTPVQTSPSQPGAATALRQNFAELEAARERARYESYMDEQEEEKMPNAFDLGWRRNLIELMGDVPLYWALPICNTKGDGWRWEPSATWLRAQDERRRRREERGMGGNAAGGDGGGPQVYSDGIWDGEGAAAGGAAAAGGGGGYEYDYDEAYDPAGIPRGDLFHGSSRDGLGGGGGGGGGDEFRGVNEPIIRRGVPGREADAETGSTDALFAVDDGEDNEEEAIGREGGKTEQVSGWRQGGLLVEENDEDEEANEEEAAWGW